MSNIVGPNDGETVTLSGGQSVSMQLLQQVYKEVTGRTEQITKRFSVNYRINFSNIENLNSIIEQILEQYHVKEKNCTVTFFHVDDCNERFSSFDRCRAYEVGSSSPLEAIRLEYEFLIVLPVVKKPQSYKIIIDVTSRSAILHRVKDESQFQRRLLRTFASSSGSVSIEYIDYAVARNMISAISGWFDSLDSRPASSIVKFAQKYSHNFNWVFKHVTAVMTALFFFIHAAPSIALDLSKVLLYGISSFASVFVLSGIAYRAGDFAEQGINDVGFNSQLDFNRGDRKINQSDDKGSYKNVVKFVMSVLVAISLNIFASWLAVKLGVV